MAAGLSGNSGFQFFVAQRAGFVFQQNGNAVAHRVGQAGAARSVPALAVVAQRALGDGADQQFEQFGSMACAFVIR
jgi:hypothetical protein